MRNTIAICSALVIISLALVAMRAAEPPLGKIASPPAKRHDPHSVAVYAFNSEGKLVGPVDTPKLVLSPAQWRRRLTAEQYKVLRAKDTEAPFCGDLLDNKKQGVYCCAGCGLPLFSSQTKFDSGTGWPSFFSPVAAENIEYHIDFGLGIPRSEVKCVRCKSHLGHVFDDGPPPTDLRFCLNSAALKFTLDDDLASLADPAAERAGEEAPTTDSRTSAPEPQPSRDPAMKSTSNSIPRESEMTFAARRPAIHESGSKETAVSDSRQTTTAVFAGGCFWCTEAAFAQLRGVSDVESGYAGGKAATATYEQVSTGNTGHAEVIRVTYDPQQISYEQLLMVFFDAHDPTQLNRQGLDVGSQYRSAIFFADEKQKAAAEAKIAELTEKHAYGARRIVTKLEPLAEFFPAEAYHQDYAQNNPLQPYVAGHSIPRACSIQKRHPELIDPEKAVRPVRQ